MKSKFDKLVDAHCVEGLRVFGEKRWNQANIGWGSSDTCIESKVYGNPCVILVSEMDKKGKITHKQENYR